MTGEMPMKMAHGLFDRTKSCLVIIDVQQYFVDKLPLDNREPLVQRIRWLMRLASVLDIPIIATAEDIARDGPLVPELAAELPPGTTMHDKMVFGLCGQPAILEDVKRSGRTEFILAGLETDVCVAHSAIGLMEQGYRVAVIEDATGSPPPCHASGIERLRGAGAIITSVKGIYYEWLRDLATLNAAKPQIHLPLPPGVTL
jgi:nicotinamidase-related amidase